MLFSDKFIERFWSKIDIKTPDECWPWMAKTRTKAGYGLINTWIDETRQMNVAASRISCVLEYGPPPHEGARALHSCDTPSCCNPRHLRWGTQKDNVADAKERKRHVNPPRLWDNPEWVTRHKAAVPKGEAVWNNSLDEPTVRLIWDRYFAGDLAAHIARDIGKPKHIIHDVIRGRSWQHLTNAPSPEQLKSARKPTGNPSLTEQEVRLIWSRFLDGESSARIANDLGKSSYVVYDVVRGKSWRHLSNAPSLEQLKNGGKRRGFNQFA